MQVCLCRLDVERSTAEGMRSLCLLFSHALGCWRLHIFLLFFVVFLFFLFFFCSFLFSFNVLFTLFLSKSECPFSIKLFTPSSFFRFHMKWRNPIVEFGLTCCLLRLLVLRETLYNLAGAITRTSPAARLHENSGKRI